jgi:hypothetical protein
MFREARTSLERPEHHTRPFRLILTPHNPQLPLTAPQVFRDWSANVKIQLDPNCRERPEPGSLFNQGFQASCSSARPHSHCSQRPLSRISVTEPIRPRAVGDRLRFVSPDLPVTGRGVIATCTSSRQETSPQVVQTK